MSLPPLDRTREGIYHSSAMEAVLLPKPNPCHLQSKYLGQPSWERSNFQKESVVLG